MPRLTFEDFEPGSVRTFGAKALTKDEIIAFARKYDAQPMHIDEEAARKGFFGTLVASGWHLCAVFMRMVADDYILESSSMGAPGIEEVRWQKPALPGDVLSIRQKVLEARTSQKRLDMGLVHLTADVLNQRGEAIMTLANWSMFGRRDAPPRPTPQVTTTVADALAVTAGNNASPPAAHGDPEPKAPLFDDLGVGRVIELGDYTFEPDDIKRFARAYDPQRFHVDEAAAKASHFGGLCASGWHTAAIWMKLMIDYRRRLMAHAAATHERVARIGPSPGFKDLKWLRPVYAGDTVTFRSEIVGKRPSESRPDWGLVFNRNTGTNQHGEPVYEFTGSAFWERAR